MFDFEYKDKLKFINVINATITGDADKLAELIEKEEAEFNPNDWNEWPSFEGGDSGSDFVWTYDASEWSDYDGTVTWSCRVNFASLDWEHPWEDRAILDAEIVYRQRKPRQQLEADAARWLQRCAVDNCGSFTPLMADRLMDVFLHEAMPCEAEESENTDPVATLLSEAMEDAKPISTGLPQLDAVLGGGLHQGVSILAGDPSAGKTSLGVYAALFAAYQQEGRTVYVMSDMGGRKSALLRLISCAAAVYGVDGCELGAAGSWSDRERYQGREAFACVSEGRIELNDTKDVRELLNELDAVEERRLAAIEYAQARSNVNHDDPDSVANYLSKRDKLKSLNRPIRFLVLDFAQAMTFDGRSLAFDTEAASLAVRELRAWAYAHNAVVLLLSAYTKGASEAHARGAAPSMTDVLGSSELSYSAEHVLALTNPHDGSGTVIVRDLKSRHGDGKPCTLHLDAEHGYFT